MKKQPGENELVIAVDADQDSAWKEMLDDYLPAFLEFFFPRIYPEIDWTRGYESLDKELAQIRPEHVTGKLLADKLFKVWLKNGKETWLLIHVEVQDRVGKGFARRIYVYNYRLVDAFGVEVVSLALITGGSKKTDKALARYEAGRWGCELTFQFPVARIADYADCVEELEKSRNPFAVVVKATLKTQETRKDFEKRFAWKREIILGLYRKGFGRNDIINLFRFLDWVMTLPPGLDEKLKQEVYEIEEGKKMPYVTTLERVAIRQGLEQGVLLGVEQERANRRSFILRLLQRQIGEVGESLSKKLSRLPMEQMDALGEALLDFESKSDLTTWLKNNAPKKPTKRSNS